MFEQLRADALYWRLRAMEDVDERVAAAMHVVDRAQFVDKDAYADRAQPIGFGQTISQPTMLALMLSAANIQPSDRVLEVGAGSGYAAAVLAQLARDVVAVERIAELAAQARTRLSSYETVRVVTGDGTSGEGVDGTFDVVIVSAGALAVPEALVARLAEGGRMLIPVGDADSKGAIHGDLLRVTRHGDTTTTDRLMKCSFVPLVT